MDKLRASIQIANKKIRPVELLYSLLKLHECTITHERVFRDVSD